MLTRALALLAAVAAALPATAAGHGADADDALLAGDTSYPVGVPAPLRRGLDGMVRQARARGYRLKVAVVQDNQDVPTPQWLVDPQAYADDLAARLPLAPGDRVLTVHPVGFGGTGLGDRPAAALDAVSGSSPARLDDLVAKAMRAVGALTRAAGVPVAVPAVATARRPDGGGGPPAWVIAGGVAVLVAAGVGLTTVLGRAGAEPPPTG